MPKMKTHKGTIKRVRTTNPKGNRKKLYLRGRRVSGARSKARKSTIRTNRKPTTISSAELKTIRKLLPGI